MSVEARAVSQSERRPLSRRGWLALGLVLSLALVAGVVAWEWRHPQVSFRYGYGISTTRDVGSTVWTTLADSDEPGGSPITLTRLEPVLQQDGAAVTVDYLVCELDPAVLEEEGVSGIGYGLSSDDVARYCRRTRPAVGADLTRRTDARQELLVGITPTRPGRTVISGHRVGYRVGWQRGSSAIHVATEITARRPHPVRAAR